MIIRNAIDSDIDFIVQEGIKFIQYHPANLDKSIDTDYLFNLGLTLIKEHVVLIAEENEIKLGMIGGMIVPNIYNPKYFGLQELFWWVKEEYRNTSAGMKLFKAFEKRAVDLQVDFISMVTTVYTPTLEKVYKKNGYKLIELSYTKEL